MREFTFCISVFRDIIIVLGFVMYKACDNSSYNNQSCKIASSGFKFINIPTDMTTYLSTFISGLQRPIEQLLKENLGVLKIHLLFDELVLYQTNEDVKKI